MVQGDDAALEKTILAYWSTSIGNAVSVQQLQNFDGWLFHASKASGYFAYTVIDIQGETQEATLVVTVVRPLLQGVRVLAESELLLIRYGPMVQQRLNDSIALGKPLDVLGLDQRLDSFGYDLPADLDATVRSIGPKGVDLVVNLTASPRRTGELVVAVTQLNNYGLRQYGQAQGVALVTLGGHSPKSFFNMATQLSEGIRYGRADYETPLEGAMSKLRVIGVASQSQSILGGAAATRGQSAELGLGLSHLQSAGRDTVATQHLDGTVRTTKSTLVLGVDDLGQLRDQQVRLRLGWDNEKLSPTPFALELALTAGQYNELSGMPQIDNASYYKAEFSLKRSFNLTASGNLKALLRMKGQWASSRLDSYNQMVLGGANGVRAYTSNDGIGDIGILRSFELQQRIQGSHTAALFVDAGQVRLLNPALQEFAETNNLQAIGVQFNGQIAGSASQGGAGGLSYSASLAKGFGGYKAWVDTNIDSTPDNWRFNGAVNYRF